MSLTLRLSKGTELTHQELDDNFTYLQGLISGSSDGVITNVAYSNGSLTFTGTSPGFSGSVDISALNTDSVDYVSSVTFANDTLTFNNVGNAADDVIDLSDLRGANLSSFSVTTAVAASGGGGLAYDSGSGVFTFTPADLSSAGGGHANISVTTIAASSGGSLAYDNGTRVLTFAPADLSGLASKISLTDLSVTAAAASGGGGLAYDSGSGVFTFTPADLSSAGGGGGIALTDLSVTTGTASGSGSLAYNSGTGVFTYSPVYHQNYALLTANGSSTGSLSPSNENDILYFKGGTNVTITAGSSSGTGDFSALTLDTLTFDVDLSNVSGSSGTTVTGIDATGTQAVSTTPALINLNGNSLGFINNTATANHYVLTWTLEFALGEGSQGAVNSYSTRVYNGPVGGALSELQRWNGFIYSPTNVSGLRASRTFTHTLLNIAPNYQTQIWIEGSASLSVVSAHLSIVEGTQESVSAQTIQLLT